MSLPSLTSFTAYTKIRSATVNANFTAIYNVLNGGLDNANLSASAAIARTKIASGTASHVVVNDGSGVLTSEAQLAASRGGTGQNMSASSGVVKVSSGTFSAGNVALASDVSGTLPVANGGTGQTTASAAINALVPSQTGNAGLYLTTNGSAVSWASAAANLSVASITVANTPYALSTSTDVVLVSASGGAVEVDLPTASGNSGKVFRIKKTDSSSNAVTVDPSGTQTIDGVSTSRTLNTQYEEITIVSDGSNWQLVDFTYPQKWTSYTPTVGNLGAGSTSANAAFWRRVGDSIEVYGYFLKDATPGSGASAVSVTLPNSYSVDTAKLPTSGGYRNAIGFGWTDVGFYQVHGVVYDASTSTVNFVEDGQTTYVTGADIGASETLAYRFTLPISGWNG